MKSTPEPLLMVTAPQLLAAADELDGRGKLRNGVVVTAAQLRKAGEILRDGPQPICNGIKADMPGFIDAERQSGKSLSLQVGILPSHFYRIDKIGRARAVS